MTKTQRENLFKLARYLEGCLKAGFSMETYTAAGNFCFEDELNCGSVGCAIGHGPYAGIAKNIPESWATYSERVFGLDPVYSLGWAWCFSGSWYNKDNTAKGAAARIRYYLKNGLPVNWEAQIYGKAPLCYKTKPRKRKVRQ